MDEMDDSSYTMQDTELLQRAKEEAVINEEGVSVYEAAEVVTQRDAKAAANAVAIELRQKQDDALQRCFAEMMCMFPDASTMLDAYRASHIPKEAFDDFASWGLLVHETIVTERKHQKHVVARAKAVAQAAEAAAKAARIAEEALRCFEADYGHTPTLPVEEPKQSKKKREEEADAPKKKSKPTADDDDEEKERRAIARRVRRNIGCEDGESVIGIMPHALFKTLNGGTETPIPEERYNARPVVDRQSLRETMKRAGDTLGAKGWDDYKKTISKHCEHAGRIMTFKEFYKQNGKLMTVRKLNKGDVWKQYNLVWDALCGTALKRIAGPKKAADDEPTDDAEEEHESAGTNADDE